MATRAPNCQRAVAKTRILGVGEEEATGMSMPARVVVYAAAFRYPTHSVRGTTECTLADAESPLP